MYLIGYALSNNGIRNGVSLEHSVNGTSLRTVAGRIGTHSQYAVSDPGKVPASIFMLCEGLAHIAAYLFIPYGEDGLNYVKEKIYPQSIEMFLQERAERLLDKTCIYKYPEYQPLVSAAFEYCQCFSQKELAVGPVSATILATRLEAELIKNVVWISYSTPKSDSAASGEFIRYKLEYFMKLRQAQLDSLDLDFHCAQIVEKYPFRKPFVFTDAHRKEIDALPIFTCLA